MPSTVDNILVGGPANIKIAAYGAGEGAAVAVGWTKGGVSMMFDREYHETSVDQVLGPIKAKKTSERCTIKFQLPESSLANLCYAFDYPTDAVTGTASFKFGNDATETYREVYINGDGPAGGTRKVTLHKVVSIGNGEHAYTKDGEAVINVEILALNDMTQTDTEEIGMVEDTGGDTTPPTVVITTPAEDGTVTQGTTNPVTLTVTETNIMDQGTIKYGETVMINDITDATATILKAGKIVYYPATKTIVFTPTVAWTTVHKFQVIVTTGMKDEAGNALAATYLGHFTAT